MIGLQSLWLAVAAVGVGFAAVAPAPASPAGDVESRIPQLISQLGDKDYSVRQRAQDELARLGVQAFDALTAASNHEDFEIASRARYLLRWIRSQSSTDKDPPEAKKLVEGYELLQDDERMLRISRLIRLPSLGGVPVACRLIRFERSDLVATYAALELLEYEPMDRGARARWSQLIRENLSAANRKGARWLLAYIALRDAPASAVESWSKLAEEEAKVLRASPEQTARGAAPLLTYLLADAYARLGDQDKANLAAERAMQLGGGPEPAQLRARLQTAFAMKRRGLFAWAEAEYRRVGEIGRPVEQVTSLVYLSEMLHDRSESLRAAEVRLQAAERLEKLPPAEREQTKETLGLLGVEAPDIRARMNYFLACHWEKKGDRAKHREYLETAIKTSPQEVDTLIALSKLPDQKQSERDRTRKLISQTCDLFRRDIADDPEDASNYNQLAWLMGNTQTNVDEALRLAKKAVELSPDNGAYLDTLAHVYFAQGDFENAVRHQARAAEVDPYSGQIVAELKRFRTAAEERKKDTKASPPPDRKG